MASTVKDMSQALAVDMRGFWKSTRSTGDVKFTFDFDREDGTPYDALAHKFVLSVRSPVFARMFSEDSKFSEARDGEVHISGEHPIVFQAFLQTMYGYSIGREHVLRWVRVHKLSEVEVNLSLISLAHRYETATILDALVPSFYYGYTAENICRYLRYAYVYRVKSLVLACHKFIGGKTAYGNHCSFFQTMTGSKAYRDLDKEMLTGLLNRAQGIEFKDFPEPEVEEEDEEAAEEDTVKAAGDESNPAKRQRT